MTAEQYKTDALPVPEQGTASYRNIHQLFKKLPHGEEIHNIFPVTYTQSVYDGKTGANLEHILHQFNHIFLQFQGTPQATRNLLPKDMRRKGIVISYRDMDNNVITETNIDELESTSDNWGLDKYWAAYGISLDQVIKIIEDYSDNQIQLTDRDSTNGMGYVILRKNKTFAEQVTKGNTIYEIRYDYDLDRGEVTIPANCTLKFNGGSISNGTLSLTNTLLLPLGLSVRDYILKGVSITGNYREGQIVYDSALKKQKLWNGTDWVNLDGTALAEEMT